MAQVNWPSQNGYIVMHVDARDQTQWPAGLTIIAETEEEAKRKLVESKNVPEDRLKFYAFERSEII